MLELDVHNLTLKEAQTEIKTEINRSYQVKNLEIRVIHGFNNGTKIKEWLRNSQTLGKNVLSVNPDLTNSGATVIHIKMKMY